MARSGVTEEQVARAADELVLAGERPTIERVRAHLGTGSPNTLIRHLDAWWKRLGERLSENKRQVELPDAPPEVAEAASAMWRLALMRAGDVAAAGLNQDREALAREHLALQEGWPLTRETPDNLPQPIDSAMIPSARVPACCRYIDSPMGLATSAEGFGLPPRLTV